MQDTKGPLLVGVVDAAGALDRYACTIPSARTVDLVEARVDLFAAEDRPVARWRESCLRLEESGTPVLVTVRLHAEGGAWKGPERERLALYQEALAVASWVDVEAQSSIAAEVAAAARAAGRTAVLSHHDFARTPPLAELRAVVEGARAHGAHVAKVATLVKSDADRQILLDLLDERGGHDDLCVIGMGAGATGDLRVLLAARGSRLAYGFLERPTAPGQISAGDMNDRLRAESPPYAARHKF